MKEVTEQPKIERKKLLIEIMEADERDGLYDLKEVRSPHTNQDGNSCLDCGATDDWATPAEQPKIDLADVEELAALLPQLNSKEDDGACLSFKDCELIAQALEALPKLVSALQKVQIDWAETDNATDPESSGYETLKLVDEALAPFTTKTPQP